MRTLHLSSALLALSALSACNDIPEGAVVGIQPELATTTDDLTAVLLTEATDKQPLTYSYAWSVDGESMPDLATDVVPADQTAKGQVWSVVVTPNDGKVDGITAEASITIANTAPTATVSLAPTDPSTLDDLVASAEGFDIDNDSVTLDWEWARDGVAVQGDSNTVGARETRKGQVWEITVTPTDGETEGQPVSASVTIGNQAPIADSVSLSPTEVYADTTLTATATGSDADEDTLTWSYAFYVSGGEVSNGPGDTLTGGFAKGDEIFVEATASDGSADSNTVQSAPVVVLNTPPSLTGASIDPVEPKGDAVLTCTAEGPADLDSDPVSTSHVWVVDGRVAKEGGTLDNEYFRKGSLVTCRVTPNDGEADGLPVESGSVEIGNTPPSIGSVAISPDPARTDDGLSVTIIGATDADGDKLGFTYSWTIGTKVVSTSSTLPSTSHSKGTIVDVSVTPTDGEDTGTAQTDSITIANTAPTAPSIVMDPTDPGPSDDLICDVDKGSLDADGDRVRYTFAWTKNGSTWTGSTSTTVYAGDTIDSTDTADKDVWACSVTPTDGTDSGTAGTASATVSDRDGQVRTVSGTWLDVEYVQCGSGSTCTGTQAKAACTAEGLKVASHASDGTTSVKDLGGTSSCHWNTSYFTVDATRSTGDCLVGVSNLDWSSCCRRGSWHGSTMKFGSAGTVFGYVRSSDSGYVSSYSNTAGRNWGCVSESTSATDNSCTAMYVACTK